MGTKLFSTDSGLVPVPHVKCPFFTLSLMETFHGFHFFETVTLQMITPYLLLHLFVCLCVCVHVTEAQSSIHRIWVSHFCPEPLYYHWFSCGELSFKMHFNTTTAL